MDEDLQIKLYDAILKIEYLEKEIIELNDENKELRNERQMMEDDINEVYKIIKKY